MFQQNDYRTVGHTMEGNESYLRPPQDQEDSPEKAIFTRQTFLILDLGTNCDEV